MTQKAHTKKTLAGLSITRAALYVKSSGRTYSLADLMKEVAAKVGFNIRTMWADMADYRSDATMNWPRCLTEDKLNRTTDAGIRAWLYVAPLVVCRCFRCLVCFHLQTTNCQLPFSAVSSRHTTDNAPTWVSKPSSVWARFKDMQEDIKNKIMPFWNE